MDTETARTHMLGLRDALARQDRASATAHAQALLAGEPALGRQWKAIGALLQHNGEVRAARVAMAHNAAAAGNAPEAVFEQAVLAAQGGDVVQAHALIQTVPRHVPDAHAHAYSRGTMAMNLGRLDEARDAFRVALGAEPGSGQAALALAMAGRIMPSDEALILAVQAHLAGRAAMDRAAWHYAAGRVFEQRGDEAGAFAAYAAGAGIMAAQRPANLQQDRDEAGQAMSGWDSASTARIARELGEVAASRPIFVTGLPRSGTTLVEQILASHSAVDGGDELGLVRLLHQDIGGYDRAAFDSYVARGGTARGLRELYDHLLGEGFGGTGRIVDKSLHAPRSIGLLRALFPDAPIVWVRRDPLDCAWSAFRTWFAQGLDWSWSLPAMAYHFKLEDALFYHWRSVFPGRIHVVAYEKLVAQPEPVIRELLEFCRLPFEAGVLQPHQTQRAVTTASVAQVRESIHARGVGSGKPFSAHLKPFLAGYYG